MYFSLSDPGPNVFAGNPVNPPGFSIWRQYGSASLPNVIKLVSF